MAFPTSPTEGQIHNEEYKYTNGMWDINVNTNTGFKNLIINGGFDIWQRGDSGTGTWSIPSADRYIAIRTGIRKPNTNGNTGEDEIGAVFDGSMISESYQHIDYNIEDKGDKLVGKTVTLSFDIKSSNMSDILIESSDIDWDGSLLPVTSTWNRVSITGVVGDHTGKDYIALRFYVSPGATVTNRIAYINNIQLELGSLATDFEIRPVGLEFTLCQRYYQVFDTVYYQGFCYNTTSVTSGNIALHTHLREADTIVKVSNKPSHITTAGRWGIYGATNGWSSTGYTPSFSVGSNGVKIEFSGVGGLTDGHSYIINGGFTLDTEF